MKISLVTAVSAVFVLNACGAAQPPQASHAGGESSGFAVIHTFAGGSDDGAEPYAGLVEHDGTLYGTTASGGPKEAGTIFTVTPSGDVKVLHGFNVEDGAQPWATPTFFHGTMFGTTATGGDSGYGNVYALQKSGKYRVVITFTLDNRGGQPYGGVTPFGAGLFGATYRGGINSNSGAVYFFKPGGLNEGVHTFGLSQNDGAHPYATLTQFDGSLYGTTSSGGDYGGGTVYTIQDISGTLSYATKYNFGATSIDGAGPRGALLKVGNKLFGTTEYGGSKGDGTVYETDSTGSETIVHSFGPGDAQNPIGNLTLFHGALYGAGSAGGAHGKGGIFKVDPSGNETLLHSFNGKSDGSNPRGSLVVYKGLLYGTASNGGASNSGTIFSMEP